MKHTAAALLGLALLTGCASIPEATAPPAATPQIIYVTQPPATATPRPTAAPTATPAPATPRPTPQPPAAVGTSWIEYLSWGIESTSAWYDLLNGPTDTIAQIKRMGDGGVDLAVSDLAWLRTHEPLPCYRALHTEHLGLTQMRLDAMQAASAFSFDAVGLLEDAIAEADVFTAMLDATSC